MIICEEKSIKYMNTCFQTYKEKVNQQFSFNLKMNNSKQLNLKFIEIYKLTLDIQKYINYN